MSMMNGGNEAIEKAQKGNPVTDKKLDKSMGIETLTIFPKQVIDGKTIITAQELPSPEFQIFGANSPQIEILPSPKGRGMRMKGEV